MEQRAAIKFCAKLKKVATATFEILKIMCDEQSLSRTNVFEWHNISKNGKMISE
jgi:hypothetical protein